MKTLIFILLAMLAIFSGMYAETNSLSVIFSEYPAVTTVKFTTLENEKVITVRITGSIKDSMEIKLCDDNGNTLYSEIVQNQEIYAKKMVLNELQNGMYNICVNRKLIKTMQSFEVTRTGILLNENGRKDVFLPQIIQKGNEICVFCFSPDNTDMNIRIYDNEGVLLMKDVNRNVNQVNKRFGLSNFPSGVYFCEMEAGKETTYLTVYYTAPTKKITSKPSLVMD